jgi:hypothetical protein
MMGELPKGEPPKRLVCSHCGGTDIAVLATAWWDEEKQDWEFSVDEGADDYCNECSNYVAGRFIPITDLRTAAIIAIKEGETNGIQE